MQKDIRETVDERIASKKMAFQKITQMHERLILPEVKTLAYAPDSMPARQTQKRILCNILSVIQA